MLIPPQVELCQNLVINSSSCRGYLHKMGSKFKNWNRRWFVFDRHKRAIVYYADKSEAKAKGGIYFQVHCVQGGAKGTLPSPLYQLIDDLKWQSFIKEALPKIKR